MLLVLNLIGKFPFLMLWNIKYEMMPYRYHDLHGLMLPSG